jgi:hypothetical protein
MAAAGQSRNSLSANLLQRGRRVRAQHGHFNVK